MIRNYQSRLTLRTRADLCQLLSYALISGLLLFTCLPCSIASDASAYGSWASKPASSEQGPDKLAPDEQGPAAESLAAESPDEQTSDEQASDVEQELQHSGLTAEFYPATSLDAAAIRRIDDRIAFDWGTDSPDSRMSPGPFRVVWSGVILIRDSVEYRWHADLQGSVRVQVGDVAVFEATAAERAFMSSEPVAISVGEHPIRIEYQSAEKAAVRLFWSAPAFTLEPLPADILFHESDSAAITSASSGRWTAESLRCGACHVGSGEADVLAGPSLDRIRDSSSLEVLIQRLTDPHSVDINSRMPSFGFSKEQASEIAAFLTERSAISQNLKFPGQKESDFSDGMQLLHSTGCGACHQLPKPAMHQDPELYSTGANDQRTFPFQGPSLEQVSVRRSPAWVYHWLKSPESLNSNHRMPVFELTDDERRKIAVTLTDRTQVTKQSQPVEATPSVQGSATSDQEKIERGRQWVEQANCSACHQIPGVKRNPAGIAVLTQSTNFSSDLSCLRPKQESEGSRTEERPEMVVRESTILPRFQIQQTQRDELVSWFKTVSSSSSELKGPTLGEHLLTSRGCLACHDRDQNRGISASAASTEKLIAEFRGESQNLIPPQLTAVGDRIVADYLSEAVSGRQKERRLPWLKVRMPKFRHTEIESAALVAYLTAADQIPDSADAVRPEVVSLSTDRPATADDLLHGNTLAGAGGFNCVACHRAGPYEPRFVAPGTRGSDLMTMGKRIRPKYFQRWMKNPIRVMTGIEMPAIRRASPGILGESLERQFEVLWQALRDPRLTPPTVVSRYEQYWTVLPGQHPRVVRDVFTVPGMSEDGQRSGSRPLSIARTFAAGFGNGHHLFFDLDHVQLRLWTIGEFARQRTEGKSWFWDPAGIVVAGAKGVQNSGAGGLSVDQSATDWLRLVPRKVQTRSAELDFSHGLRPVMDEGRTAELVKYETTDAAIRIWYRMYFATSDSERVGQGDASAGTDASSPHDLVTRWTDSEHPVASILLEEVWTPIAESGQTGIRRKVWLRQGIPAHDVILVWPELATGAAYTPQITTGVAAGTAIRLQEQENTEWMGSIETEPIVQPIPAKPILRSDSDAITSVPRFKGNRLPLDTSIMPTAMTWLPDGRLAFTSLRGHVWIGKDTNEDGQEDELQMFEEGLAAPFGILADGDSIIVAHKPEVLRLRDTDGDGKADQREILASGWGFSDDYHDWTSGLVRDKQQNLYVGLGSDYSQKERSSDRDRWRGTILKIDPSGQPSPYAYSFRYPMSIAIDDMGRMFATDNQGVQNTFNEINYVLPGRHYGVPSKTETIAVQTPETPALQVPHPWTRSVNSILFLPERYREVGMAGHGVGCEYDLRFLVRFTTQQIGDIVQGCVYPLSLPEQTAGGANFVGPICSGIAPDGSLYIGSIWDSGWQGGPNTGAIERLTPEQFSESHQGDLRSLEAHTAGGHQNGIQEIRLVPGGFELEFFLPVDETILRASANYTVQGYTRVWGGSYATPDSERHDAAISEIKVSDDLKSVKLTIPKLRAGFVYDISLREGFASEQFWPVTGTYTLKTLSP